METDGIAFIMLNRRSASPPLVEYVERVLSLAVVAQDEERTLYRSARIDSGQSSR